MKRLLFQDERKRLDITQRDVERKLALPSGSVSVIESGKVPVPDDYFDDVLFPTMRDLVDERKKEEGPCQEAAA